MRMIFLANRKGVALIDDEDWDRVAGFNWALKKNYEGRGTRKYAVTNIYKERKRTTITLHQMILKTGKDQRVDHIDGDGLNNQKTNLRFATNLQNSYNTSGRGGSSKFKGVSYAKSRNKWLACISANSIQKSLGYFDSEIEAALAYDTEAKQLHGEFARLNFV